MEDLLVVAKNFWILLNGKIFQNREENLNLLYKHISPFTHSSSYIIFWGECTRSFVKHTSLGISGSRLTWNANNFTGGRVGGWGGWGWCHENHILLHVLLYITISRPRFWVSLSLMVLLGCMKKKEKLFPDFHVLTTWSSKSKGSAKVTYSGA